MGRTVNELRKLGGQTGKSAKHLVKKWKKLLPDNGHSTCKHSDKVAQQQVPTDSHRSAAAPNATLGHQTTFRWQAGDQPQPPSHSKRHSTSEHGARNVDVKRKKVDAVSAVTSTSAAGFRAKSLKDLSSTDTRPSPHKKTPVNYSHHMPTASSKSSRNLDTPTPAFHSSHSASPTLPPRRSGKHGGQMVVLPRVVFCSSSHTVSPTRHVPSVRPSDSSAGKKRRGWVGDVHASKRGRDGGRWKRCDRVSAIKNFRSGEGNLYSLRPSPAPPKGNCFFFFALSA